jgi:hypothetical protein
MAMPVRTRALLNKRLYQLWRILARLERALDPPKRRR